MIKISDPEVVALAIDLTKDKLLSPILDTDTDHLYYGYITEDGRAIVPFPKRVQIYNIGEYK